MHVYKIYLKLGLTRGGGRYGHDQHDANTKLPNTNYIPPAHVRGCIAVIGIHVRLIWGHVGLSQVIIEYARHFDTNMLV